MDGDNFGNGWISQLCLSHSSAAREIAQRLHVPVPPFFDGFAQIVTENWPHLKLSELQGQKLSLVPAASLDLFFWHGHHVAIADLAQLLRNHGIFPSWRAVDRLPAPADDIPFAQYIQ